MKLVIKPHRPRQRVLISVGLLLLVTGAIITAFDYGRWQSIISSMGAANLKRGIMDDFVDLRQENEATVKELAKLERAIEIDQYAR